MFTKFKNIDTAFKHIKLFSYILTISSMLVICFTIYKFCQAFDAAHSKIYILQNGKVLEAYASDRKTNLPVELRDHIKTFHQYFFNLTPDETAIKVSITKALYLADGSAKKEYDNLRESGYYNNLVSANISQEIDIDSIKLNVDQIPYDFIYYGTEKLVRSSSTVYRKLVTKGHVRVLKSVNDNNPHGFLIQDWEIIENKDVELDSIKP